jgi:hypothetical protein
LDRPDLLLDLNKEEKKQEEGLAEIPNFAEMCNVEDFDEQLGAFKRSEEDE